MNSHMRRRGFVTRTALLSLNAGVVNSVYAGWFSAPTWEGIHSTIRQRFPQVEQLSISQFRTMLNQKIPVILLDARTQEEFDTSHLANAHWTQDLASAQKVVRGLAPQTQIIIYCSVGWRSSALAQQMMMTSEQHPIYNLEGSMFAWANAGLPVYRGTRLVTKVHPYNPHWGRLLSPTLHAPATPLLIQDEGARP